MSVDVNGWWHHRTVSVFVLKWWRWSAWWKAFEADMSQLWPPWRLEVKVEQPKHQVSNAAADGRLTSSEYLHSFCLILKVSAAETGWVLTMTSSPYWCCVTPTEQRVADTGSMFHPWAALRREKRSCNWLMIKISPCSSGSGAKLCFCLSNSSSS